MEQSYIPEGTDVICTEMTSGKPTLLVKENGATVFYGKDKRALLNRNDKKLSCSLQCRIAQGFYSGLLGLLAGLALGAVAVVFVIGTAGVGGAVLAVAVGATLSLAAGGLLAAGATIASKYSPHQCDSSLSGNWDLCHNHVLIQKEKALLQHSILTCSKGGVISFVMDPAKAQELAKTISNTNQQILDKNMMSKFWQGVIGNGSNALLGGTGSVVGVVLGSGLSIYHYYMKKDSNYRDDNTRQQNIFAQEMLHTNQAEFNTDDAMWSEDDTKDNIISTAAGVGTTGIEATMNVITHNKAITQESVAYATRSFEYVLAGNEIGAGHAAWASDLAWNSGKGFKDIGSKMIDDLWRGSTPAFGRNISNKWFTLGGIGIGILSSIASNMIERTSNKAENDLYEEMILSVIDMRKGTESNIHLKAQQL